MSFSFHEHSADPIGHLASAPQARPGAGGMPPPIVSQEQLAEIAALMIGTQYFDPPPSLQILVSIADRERMWNVEQRGVNGVWVHGHIDMTLGWAARSPCGSWWP